MKKPISVTGTKPRRKFDQTFKEEALAMWANSSKSATEIASELGIDNPNVLYTWRQKMTAKSSNAASQTPAQQAAEIQQLRRENERLRQQRDILKKTLGIISEPSGNGMNGSRP